MHTKHQNKTEQTETVVILENLNKKLDVLQDKFDDFKTIIQNQNKFIMEMLKQNNSSIKNIITNKTSAFTDMFPVKSVDQLQALEDSINESNRPEYATTIKFLIGKKGLKAGLSDIVDPNVLMLFNVDGIHNKQRLLDYKNFINILFLASYDKDASDKSFKEDLKRALKTAKNRYFKRKTREQLKV